MKTYYYCNADHHIYTETEKKKSLFPGCRFETIGQFKNRRSAEDAFLKAEPPIGAAPVSPSSHYVMTQQGGYRK